MKGCGWMTYHFTAHTVIMQVNRKTSKPMTVQVDGLPPHTVHTVYYAGEPEKPKNQWQSAWTRTSKLCTNTLTDFITTVLLADASSRLKRIRLGKFVEFWRDELHSSLSVSVSLSASQSVLLSVCPSVCLSCNGITTFEKLFLDSIHLSFDSISFIKLIFLCVCVYSFIAFTCVLSVN